uniref:Plus3 domain-containing protein n=1 Tax=Meloidogyne enterolobii TaxID=390850 RepID=A0A6V7UBR2_MELEN|nr:unnamed protein product [Meloidogyne enterolobii]
MSIESDKYSSNFANGTSNNCNSASHQSIQYPDEPSEGIRACILGRERISKLFSSPDFAKTIVDCFVRVVDQSSDGDIKKYKIARVVSVLDNLDHGCYGENKGKLLQLDDKTEIDLDVISEDQAEELEIQQWLMSLIRKNKPTPSIDQLINKITEISSALSWPFSPDERQTEPDYHSINEGINLVESIIESEVTDVQHVLSGVVESVESEEINEYLIDQEITENLEISEMAAEQIFHEPEEPDIIILEPDIGINIDNIPSEFNQIFDNNEGVQHSDNQSNQAFINSDTLMGGYETEDKRFKMVIADDDGIIGSPNKQRAKEKNSIEYIEYLDDILPIILSKTFIIQTMHSAEFNQLVTDCFVFVKYDKDSNENEGTSKESTNKEEYKLAKICKVEDTEIVYRYEDLFFQKRILLDSNDDLFELSLNNVLDQQPTNEEFKKWVLAISTKAKKSIKVNKIIPTLQFVISKHVKIDSCRTNSLLEKNLKLYELANKEASIIYEKQNKITTYNELLQIFLKRSEILKIVRHQSFSKTIIGTFVRFLYNLPNVTRSEHSQAQDSLRYKIVQIVGVHKCEFPYPVGRFSVDKELKIEWDRVIVHCKISSISDTIPTQKEFDNWMTAIENKHSESTIPSIHFLKSKSVAIKNALDLEKEEQINFPKTSETNKDTNYFEMSTIIVAESQSQTKNTVQTPEPFTAKSNISSSTPTFARPSVSTPAIATDIPTTSSGHKLKGFGIFKHLRNGLSEGPQLRKKETPTMKAPLLRKTAKKAQPKMQAPVRNFYNQLTQKDKEILLRNGFKGAVNVRINKREFEKSMEFANCFEFTRKNKNVDSKLLSNTLERLQAPANRKRPRSPPISSNDNLSSSTEASIGACANISVGEPISISKNVGVLQNENPPSEIQQPQQKIKKQDSLTTLPAQINKLKVEIIEVDEVNK